MNPKLVRCGGAGAAAAACTNRVDRPVFVVLQKSREGSMSTFYRD